MAMLSRFYSFWLFPLLGMILLFISVRQSLFSGFEWLGLALIGVLLWSLLEYSLHRFAFHGESPTPVIGRIRQQIHLHHHVDPRNPDRILVRPVFSLPISALFFALFYFLTGTFAGATGLMIGLWAGFLYYESVHYRLHLSRAGGGLIRHQRGWHFYHHFVDDNYCFGVTSPLWDLVLGTFKRPHHPR